LEKRLSRKEPLVIEGPYRYVGRSSEFNFYLMSDHSSFLTVRYLK